MDLHTKHSGRVRILLGLVTCLAVLATYGPEGPGQAVHGIRGSLSPKDTSGSGASLGIPATVPAVIPSTTVTTPPNPSTHVGDTESLSSQYVYGSVVQRTITINVTVTGIDDPSRVKLAIGPPPPGDRTVDLDVTLTNVGDIALPMVGGGTPSTPTLLWALDPEYRNQGYEGPIEHPGPPAVDCQGTPQERLAPLDPGQSLSGCVFFDVPDGVAITSASAQVFFAGGDYGNSEVWSVP
jgi:hypothetical protein